MKTSLTTEAGGAGLSAVGRGTLALTGENGADGDRVEKQTGDHEATPSNSFFSLNRPFLDARCQDLSFMTERPHF